MTNPTRQSKNEHIEIFRDFCGPRFEAIETAIGELDKKLFYGNGKDSIDIRIHKNANQCEAIKTTLETLAKRWNRLFTTVGAVIVFILCHALWTYVQNVFFQENGIEATKTVEKQRMEATATNDTQALLQTDLAHLSFLLFTPFNSSSKSGQDPLSLF